AVTLSVPLARITCGPSAIKSAADWRSRSATSSPQRVSPHIAATTPTQLLQRLLERRDSGLAFSIIRSPVHKHANPPHTLRLLRARRERPRGRAAEEHDEVAAVHSMTSAARRRNDSGIARPSALAVVRLITRSYLVGCSTGRSPGFAPSRILWT